MQRIKATDVVALTICLLAGGFPEWVSCITTVALAIGLLVRIVRQRLFRVQKDLLTLTVGVLSLMYGMTTFWAIDNGMAFLGFLKFLPLLLYILLLQQQEDTGRLTAVLPYAGAAVTAVTGTLALCGVGTSLLTVADRFAGVFQYPNTYAAFLLVCLLLLLKNTRFVWYDILTALLLISGLLYTGSRAVFVLSAVSVTAMLFVRIPHGKRLLSAGMLLVAAAVGFAVLYLFGDGVLERYLSISLTESTFVGRLLYSVDALPLLLKYPFGMGYMGYAYTQMSVQTGVYTIAYIHNDLMQIFLDVGWLVGILCLACVVRFFADKSFTSAHKIVAATLILHALFDFDMQYLMMGFLLITLLYRRSDKEIVVNTGGRMITCAVLGVMALVSLYMTIPLLSEYVGARNLSHSLYPYNTRNTVMMLETEELARANELADDILMYNTSSYIPYSVKSRYAYSTGDFTQVIGNKRAVIERAPFQYSELEEYARMLIQGIALYERNDDTASVSICKNELIQLQRYLTGQHARLSKLGSMIVDQPTVAFPKEIASYIDGLEGSE